MLGGAPVVPAGRDSADRVNEDGMMVRATRMPPISPPLRERRAAGIERSIPVVQALLRRGACSGDDQGHSNEAGTRQEMA